MAGELCANGDVLELDLEMLTRLLAGNHRSEHIRNQVAVNACVRKQRLAGDVQVGAGLRVLVEFVRRTTLRPAAS